MAFSHLAELPVTIRPKALLSSAMTLLDGLRDELEARFGCPVFDVYGLNEAGPVAASAANGAGHVLVQPALYVEILDDDGRPVAARRAGVRSCSPAGSTRPSRCCATERVITPRSSGAAGSRRSSASKGGRRWRSRPATGGRSTRSTSRSRCAPHGRPVHAAPTRRPGPSTSASTSTRSSPAARAAFVTTLADLFGPVHVDVHDLADQPERPTYSADARR